MVKIDPMYYLINTIRDGKDVVIFLGGGASMEGKQGEKPYPGFDELIGTVLKDWGFNPNERKKRFEKFLLVIKKWEDEQKLSARLSKYLEGEPGLAHYYLAALSIVLFSECNALLYLTTNYDDLMRKAFTDLERNPLRRFSTKSISLPKDTTSLRFQEIVNNIEAHMEKGYPVIVKLFGDLDSQCPIFRQDDMKFQEEVEKKLIEWLKRPMIFIGYSFKDQVIQKLVLSSITGSPSFIVNPSDDIPEFILKQERVYHIKKTFSEFIDEVISVFENRGVSIRSKIEKLNPAEPRKLYSVEVTVGGISEVIDWGWDGVKLLDEFIRLDYATTANLLPHTEGNSQQWAPVFINHPDTWRMLFTEPCSIVGYWHFAPLFPDDYEMAKKGQLLDSCITVDRIPFFEFPGQYEIYFVQVSLYPQFRKLKTLRLLFETIFQVMENLSANGVFLSEVCVNAYTDAGRALCKTFKMRYLCEHVMHGSIYTAPIKTIFANSLTKNFPTLKVRYKEEGLI